MIGGPIRLTYFFHHGPRDVVDAFEPCVRLICLILHIRK